MVETAGASRVANGVERLAPPVAIAGLLLVIAASEPRLWTAHAAALRGLLLACVAFFAVLLAVRLRGRRRAPCLAAAVMAGAGPLAWIAGADEPSLWLACGVWVLAVAERSHALPLLARVVARERGALTGVGTLFFVLLAAAAILGHLAEREAQPDAFGTLPRALWWAVATVTTTGYGDAVPRSGAGRIIAACVMVGGLGMFGLFTGILATGFAEETRRRDFLRTWDVVARVPFFGALPPETLAALASATRRLDVPARTVLARRGRHGETMYFIVSGEVTAEVTPPARLGAGQFFGEMALLGDGVRSATVTARTEATLLALDIAPFRRLCAAHPELAEAIATEASRRTSLNLSVAGARSG